MARASEDTLVIQVARRPNSRVREAVILVNGVPLLDSVREIERCFVEDEASARAAEGEAKGDVRFEPGDYMYPVPPVDTGEFFGRVESYFALAKDDPRFGKTVLLGCRCGEPGCWPLLARITHESDAVVWSDFEQFHRDWSYPLGPFRFSASDYWRALGAATGGR